MLLLFLTVIYFCVVYVGQKPTRACVELKHTYSTDKVSIYILYNSKKVKSSTVIKAYDLKNKAGVIS
jgi:hypothetical protein